MHFPQTRCALRYDEGGEVMADVACADLAFHGPSQFPPAQKVSPHGIVSALVLLGFEFRIQEFRQDINQRVQDDDWCKCGPR